MDITVKFQIVSFFLLLLAISQANSCYVYKDGLVDDRYNIVFGEAIPDYGFQGASKYLYSSQVNGGVWIDLKNENKYSKETELSEYIKDERSGASLHIDYSGGLYTQAVWISSDGLKKLPFKAWVDPQKYLKVKESKVSGNRISIYRRQIGAREYILSISVNDGKAIPILKSGCGFYFGNDLNVEFYGENNEFMFVAIQSWPAGGGSLSTEVTAIFDLINNTLVSWEAVDSGSGGASSYSNGNRTVVLNNDVLTIVKKTRSSGRDDKRYTQIITNEFSTKGRLELISSVKKLETYIHQELISEETTETPIKSAKYSLINKRSEHFPPNI